MNSDHLGEQREQQGVLKEVRIAIKSHPVCQPLLGEESRVENVSVEYYIIFKYSEICFSIISSSRYKSVAADLRRKKVRNPVG